MNIAVRHVQIATVAGSIGHILGETVIVIESLSDKSCITLSYHNDINHARSILRVIYDIIEELYIAIFVVNIETCFLYIYKVVLQVHEVDRRI